MRRLNGAGTQDDFFTGPGFARETVDIVLNPDGFLAFQNDLAGERIGFDLQVVAPANGVQERPAHAIAPPPFLGHLIVTKTFLTGAVVVIIFRIPLLFRRVDKCIEDRIGLAQIFDLKWPADTMVLGTHAGVVLGFLEVRQHILERPTTVAELCPVIIVSRLAPNIEHPVD